MRGERVVGDFEEFGIDDTSHRANRPGTYLVQPQGWPYCSTGGSGVSVFFFKLDTFNQSLDTLREPWMNESPAVTCCALLCSLGRSDLPELHVDEKRFYTPCPVALVASPLCLPSVGNYGPLRMPSCTLGHSCSSM